MLRLSNSLGPKKEPFKSLSHRKVKMYVCGVTPYDTTHLGHAFTYVFYDVLIRYLISSGYDVTYTQNVTDIDDDVLRKAKEQKRDWRELGEFWTNRFTADMRSLNVLTPTYYVKATDSIEQIKKIVGELVRKKLHTRVEEMYILMSRSSRITAGFRSSTKGRCSFYSKRGEEILTTEKKNKLDFILWQKWKAGEPYWESPWGKGRPGWHIECSAMINQYMGAQIDIHGGGRDLIFPHHESEIAQSESYTGKKPFSRFFLHTSMVMCMGEKMSKSLGNLVLVSDLLKNYSPNAIRWTLLSHHYKQIWEYNKDELDDASAFTKKLERLLKNKAVKSGTSRNSEAIKKFEEVMDDDVNTPQALSILKKLLDDGKDDASIRYISNVLGFLA